MKLKEAKLFFEERCYDIFQIKVNTFLDIILKFKCQ